MRASSIYSNRKSFFSALQTPMTCPWSCTLSVQAPASVSRSNKRTQSESTASRITNFNWTYQVASASLRVAGILGKREKRNPSQIVKDCTVSEDVVSDDKVENIILSIRKIQMLKLLEQMHSLGITHAALRAQNFDLPDSLVAMTGSSRKNLRKFDIQSQNEEGRKDDDAYYATDGSL